MKAPNEKPEVQLTGNDGNAFSVMGRISKALRIAGADKEYIDKYIAEATSGDYSHLLSVSMEYVNAN